MNRFKQEFYLYVLLQDYHRLTRRMFNIANQLSMKVVFNSNHKHTINPNNGALKKTVDTNKQQTTH